MNSGRPIKSKSKKSEWYKYTHPALIDNNSNGIAAQSSLPTDNKFKKIPLSGSKTKKSWKSTG